LEDAFLAKLPCDDALGNFFMAMARLCPCPCKFIVVNEAGLLEPEDDRLRNVFFYATGLKVSEKLALTLCSTNKCVECNCVSN
jgi:hypothetical protein